MDASVLALEERALAAWPALDTEEVAGWILRRAEGCTKRANSANALKPHAGPAARFEDVRATVEAFYASADLPAIFRLSPLAPPEVDQALANAGYGLVDPSLVLTGPLASSVASEPSVVLVDRPDPAWLNGVAQANGVAPALREAHAAIVSAIRRPAAFATMHEGDTPVGYGIAVVERGMVGLFDVVVLPAFRRRGHGEALCRALLGWGRSNGAQAAYLQVTRTNLAARRLYARLGFETAYGYHYRVAPAPKIA